MDENEGLWRIKEPTWLRGFANMMRKESRAWWGTRRWWVNALLWPVAICGLTANMLFLPTLAGLASKAEIAQHGGLTAYVLYMGLSAFFEFGASVLAIGTIILLQDAILSEKQSGLVDWLLSKPLARRSYVLAKVAANALAILLLLVALPSAVTYVLLSLRLGSIYPPGPFVLAVGILALHCLFYLTLTLALGTVVDNRGPILAVGLGSALGGSLVGGFLPPLLSVTPWMLGKVATLTAGAQAVPAEIGIAPLAATLLWSVAFVALAVRQFERKEF
jgi:ABC-type transport system involved in multi-copper enzyme maturation permease subunit